MTALDHVFRIDQSVINEWQDEGFVKFSDYNLKWEVISLNQGEEFFQNLSSLLWDLCVKIYYWATTIFCVIFGIPTFIHDSTHNQYSHHSRESFCTHHPEMKRLIEERSSIICLEAALDYIKPSYEQRSVDTILNAGIIKILRHVSVLDLDIPASLIREFGTSLATKEMAERIFRKAQEIDPSKVDRFIEENLSDDNPARIDSEEIISLFDHEGGYRLSPNGALGGNDYHYQTVQERNQRGMSGVNTQEDLYRGLAHFATFSKNQQVASRSTSGKYPSTALVTIGNHSFMVGITRDGRNDKIIEASVFHPSSHPAITGYPGAGIMKWNSFNLDVLTTPLEKVASFLEALARDTGGENNGFSITPLVQRIN